nr:uncharacterized protein LOC123570463 isoform X2 [Macaca fascicularis]
MTGRGLCTRKTACSAHSSPEDTCSLLQGQTELLSDPKQVSLNSLGTLRSKSAPADFPSEEEAGCAVELGRDWEPLLSPEREASLSLPLQVGQTRQTLRCRDISHGFVISVAALPAALDSGSRFSPCPLLKDLTCHIFFLGDKTRERGLSCKSCVILIPVFTNSTHSFNKHYGLRTNQAPGCWRSWRYSRTNIDKKQKPLPCKNLHSDGGRQPMNEKFDK